MLNRKFFISGERPYSCEFCGKQFSQSINLRNHKLIHTGNKLHGCEYCGKLFLRTGNLKKHVADHANAMGKYQAEQAEMAKQGNGQEAKGATCEVPDYNGPYKCDVCGENFAHPGNLRIHINVHIEEKKNCCDICGKEFMDTEHLKTHVMTHTQGKLPYRCGYCGLQFPNVQSLTEHSVIHETSKILP